MDFNLVQEPGTYGDAYYSTSGANTGANNSFDFNQIASGISSIATPLFGFIEGMYAVSQNQPPRTGSGQQPQIVYHSEQQPQQSNNTVMYVVAAIFLLLLIALGVYAFKK